MAPNFQNDPISIPLDQIDEFSDNPFPVEEDDEFKELAEDIRINGLADPVTVFPEKDGRYQLVSGHRRKLAFEKMGMKTIPCHVIEPLSDEQLRLKVVQFNEGRKKVKPSTRIRAAVMKYDAIAGIHKEASVEDLYELAARDTGISRVSLFRLRKLSTLPDETLKLMDEGKISMRTAGIMADMDDRTFAMLVRKLKKDPSVVITEKKATRIRKLENPRADRIGLILTDGKRAAKKTTDTKSTSAHSPLSDDSRSEYARIAEAALYELHPEMRSEKDKTAEIAELLLWTVNTIKRARTDGEYAGRTEGEIMAALTRKMFNDSLAKQYEPEFSEGEDLDDDLEVFSANSGPKPKDDLGIDFDERPEKGKEAYKPKMPD